MSEFYENHLENVNSGLFLQLEGSVGRYYVNNFLDTGIFKPSGEEGNTIKDGYNRTITLHKHCFRQLTSMMQGNVPCGTS